MLSSDSNCDIIQAIDIKLQNGYGLTESSPVVACRRPNCNVILFTLKLCTPSQSLTVIAEVVS